MFHYKYKTVQDISLGTTLKYLYHHRLVTTLIYLGTTSITGSFTLEPRDAVKWSQIFKKHCDILGNTGGWVNKIGLRNPGIDYAIQNYKKDTITSIAILKRSDVATFNERIPNDMNLEINISCPNVDHKLICDDIEVFLNNKRKYTIVKLSPTDNMDLVDKLYLKGFRQFHFSNTLPTKLINDCKHEGGMSGSVLIPYTSKLVVDTRLKYDDVEIIAGGGIQNIDVARHYKSLGANHLSFSSVMFHPLRFAKFYTNLLWNNFWV